MDGNLAFLAADLNFHNLLPSGPDLSECIHEFDLAPLHYGQSDHNSHVAKVSLQIQLGLTQNP